MKRILYIFSDWPWLFYLGLSLALATDRDFYLSSIYMPTVFLAFLSKAYDTYYLTKDSK
jgi:hypothetical protein